MLYDDAGFDDPATRIEYDNSLQTRVLTPFFNAVRATGRAFVASTNPTGAKGVLSAALVLASLCAPHAVEAQSTLTYSYTSQTFSYTNLTGTQPADPCTLNLSITFSGVSPGFTGTVYVDNIIAFEATSVCIGSTMTSSTPGYSYLNPSLPVQGQTYPWFTFSDGEITAWFFSVFSSDNSIEMESAHQAPPNVDVDSAIFVYDPETGQFYEGQNVNMPGTWDFPGTQPQLAAGKTLGPASDVSCACEPTTGAPVSQAGDPITTGTGNVFETFADYTTAGQNPLTFVRYFNSSAGSGTLATTLSTNWRSNYDRYLNLISSSAVTAERPDGQILTFTLTGGAWIPDSDVDFQLVQNGSIWTLTDHSDNVETYSMTGINGILQSIRQKNGYMQTMAYTAGLLTSVMDSYARSLILTYANGFLSTVSTPDGLTLTYGFSSSGINGSILDRLASVTYSTNPATTQTYVYENAAFPFMMTGIIDEDNNRYATWTYDGAGRGVSSQLGTGAGLTTVTSYNVYTPVTSTVTNAFGVQDTYYFQTLQGVPKVAQISRAATATTAAAMRTFGYDSNGYLNSATDWNGNLTTYVNDVHGDPTTINEAVGTPQARTTNIEYDPTFVHLPKTVTTQGVTTGYVYDPNENPLTKTLTDTTTQTVPYSTNGEIQQWTYTWQNFLLASVKSPNGNLTQYGYDSTGALISTTNALKQITNITQHTGGGYPLVIVDPNSVTTTLTYSPRLWLLTSTISATGQPSFTTTNGYDAAGNLTSIQLPDNSKLTYGYDTAHRLTSVTDLFGNATTYTLDALGDVTLTNLTNPQATVTRTHSGVFDALGRVLQDIGGVGQTTTYTYDNNGNALTVTDPRKNLTQQSFDPLNRLSTVTDPAPGGVTTTTYDQHDRVLTVTDQNSNVTSYVYDGFGDKIQTVSPDTKTSVYYYDADSNLTKSTNAAGAVANYTYDALDRVLTTTYPKDTAENVAYTYDQSGHGYGIGHLTSLTDAAGSLSRNWDTRGNLTADTRTVTAGALATSYSYDPASRVSGIGYASGTAVTYTRDKMGRITAVSAQAPGAPKAGTVASKATYEPFGPVKSLTFGNAVAESWAFDLDYRPTSLTDTGTAAVQKLTYHYDPANNVKTIIDGVIAANSQSFDYDSHNRLTSATGGYGTFGYGYDPVSNILSQIQNGTKTTYSYAPGSNRIAKTKTGSTAQTVTTTAAGEISGFSPPLNNVAAMTYNQAARLATASSSTGHLAQYTYDAFGNRTIKTGSLTATTIYQYDQAGHLLEETAGPGSAKVDYIYLGDRPIGTVQPSNSKTYFLHDDRLGTPQVATDSSQIVQWTAAYQPYGYTSTGASGIVQNLRPPGQEWDTETWLYHNGFRNYAPTMTRYMESDPIGLASGTNTFAYVDGNPIKRFDPRGLWYIDANATGKVGTAGLQIGPTGLFWYNGVAVLGEGKGFSITVHSGNPAPGYEVGVTVSGGYRGLGVEATGSLDSNQLLADAGVGLGVGFGWSLAAIHTVPIWEFSSAPSVSQLPNLNLGSCTVH